MIVNNRLLTMNLLHSIRRFHCSKIEKSAYEGSGKSTINIINVAGPKLFITSCSSIGFKLNNNSTLVGPLAIFPTTFLCWNIASGKDINNASLSLFTIIEPKLDVLVLGIETKYDFKRILELKKLVGEKNISVEILPTDRACGVYNFLCEEGRHVAAGLIPPLPEETLTYKKLTATMRSIGNEKLITSE
ncbi:NADH dehydrogenase [ubiquinone] 1 alpha subcomplex assembly factor 3 [Megachile rotundata]|uniref:NADH dehydrogenase [ubiquinone] 1 alpha subcomplex assembly factor 3 n=1 Tax=Megachile rotundata TaxID=143995 RepID=UPI0006154075|nr:PREDICTED: NADH dehydrogenase [ubiquinone] 1 alpha subcomplex assembly factor 3 [Megachile rotundata]